MLKDLHQNPQLSFRWTQEANTNTLFETLHNSWQAMLGPQSREDGDFQEVFHSWVENMEEEKDAFFHEGPSCDSKQN